MKKEFKEINILLAEDNEDEVLLMKEALLDNGATGRLDVVSDGQVAIDYLENPDNKRPDLMILDLNMPKKNGFQVLQHIKKNDDIKILPVIIFTNSQNPDDIRMAYENFAACYIAKPMSYIGLKEAIGRIQDFWSNIVKFPDQ